MNVSGNFCFISGLMAVLTLNVHADTFFLKDGSHFEGTIVREDTSSYVIEVQVTKSIKDERVIPKDNVAKMEGEKKDLTAFGSISHFIPTPDALAVEEYASRITTVEKFLKDYPDSSKSSQAKAILSVLKKEANEILAGGIKYNGKIITAAEYRANALDIDAGIQEAAIRARLKDGRYVEALRAFSAFDRDFHNTKAYAALLPLMIQTINGYLAQTAQALAGYDALIKQREIGLQRMQPDDRRKTQTAIAEETAQLEKGLKAEKEAKIGWVTTHPSFKPSLEETMTFGKQELTRLTAAATPLAVDAGTAFRDALRKIQNSTDATAKNSTVGEAKTAMVSEKYLAILTAAAASR
jgi:hypothetical protein